MPQVFKSSFVSTDASGQKSPQGLVGMGEKDSENAEGGEDFSPGGLAAQPT
jgi:hypothetical protein